MSAVNSETAMGSMPRDPRLSSQQESERWKDRFYDLAQEIRFQERKEDLEKHELREQIESLIHHNRRLQDELYAAETTSKRLYHKDGSFTAFATAGARNSADQERDRELHELRDFKAAALNDIDPEIRAYAANDLHRMPRRALRTLAKAMGVKRGRNRSDTIRNLLQFQRAGGR